MNDHDADSASRINGTIFKLRRSRKPRDDAASYTMDFAT